MIRIKETLLYLSNLFVFSIFFSQVCYAQSAALWKITSTAKTNRDTSIELNLSALDKSSFNISLPEKSTLPVTINNREKSTSIHGLSSALRLNTSSAQSIRGVIAKNSANPFVLSVIKNKSGKVAAVSGLITYGATQYELISKNGRPILRPIIPQKIGQCSSTAALNDPNNLNEKKQYSWLENQTNTIRLLLFYTKKAEERVAGEYELMARVYAAIEDLNQSFINSQVDAKIEVAGILRTDRPFDVEGDLVGDDDDEKKDDSGKKWKSTFADFANSEEVKDSKEAFFADLVGLIVFPTNPTPFGGKGTIGGYITVTHVDGLLASRSLAHEIGHNLGAHHDYENTRSCYWDPETKEETCGEPSPGYFKDSFGWYWTNASDNNVYGDIMSYEGLNLPFYSNPEVAVEGYPTGTEKANNARALNAVAKIAALYEPEPDTLSLAVSVADESGAPLKDVEFSPSKFGLYKTDSEGYLNIRGIPKNSLLEMIPTKPGYSFSPSATNVSMGENNMSVQFNALAVPFVQGTVKVGDTPVISIFAVRINDGSDVTGMITSAEGTFSFPAPGNSVVEVTPHIDGVIFDPVSLSAEVKKDMLPMEFVGRRDTLKSSGIIGRIVMSDNRKLPKNIEIDVSRHPSSAVKENGYFKIFPIKPNQNITITPHHPSLEFSPASISGDVEEGWFPTFNAVEKSYMLGVKVVDQDGKPVQGVKFQLPTGYPPESDANGEAWRSPYFDGDKVSIVPSKPNYKFNPISVNALISGDTAVSFRAYGGNENCNIKVTAQDARTGKGIANSQIDYFLDGKWSKLGETTSIGVLYSSAVVPPGKYVRVRVAHDGYDNTFVASDRPCDKNENIEIKLAVQPKSFLVTGKVLTSESLPVGDLVIDGATLGTVRTDYNGSYSFNVPYLANYVIKPAIKPGYIFWPVDIRYVLDEPKPRVVKTFEAVDVRPPQTPPHINASFADPERPDHIRVSWDGVSRAESYSLYRDFDCGENQTLIATRYDGQTEYKDLLAKPGIVYFYRVRANGDRYRNKGSSELSQCAKGLKLGPPPAPDNVKATDGSFNYVLVTWNTNLEADSYKIYRSLESNGSYYMVGSVDKFTSSFKDESEDLKPGQRAFYKVSSSNEADEGKLSAYAIGSKTAPPEGKLTIRAARGEEANRVKVSWNSLGKGIYYTVERSAEQDGGWKEAPLPNNEKWPRSGTTYYDAFSEAGKEYWYRVTGKNDQGSVGPSLPDVGWSVGAPSAPNWVSASDNSTGAIKIQWAPYEGNAFSRYTVYRSRSADGPFDRLNLGDIYDQEVTEFLDADADDGLIYYYKVQSATIAGESKVDDSPTDLGFRNLTAPRLEGVSEGLDGVVEVKFSYQGQHYDESEESLLFTVWRKKSGESEKFEKIASNIHYSWPMSYEDKQIEAGKRYYYTVSVAHSVSKLASPQSSTKSGYAHSNSGLLGPVRTQASDGTSPLGVNIEWEKIEGASRYRVYRSPGVSKDFPTTQIAETTDSSLIDKKTPVKEIYTYGVVALDSEKRLGELGQTDQGFRGEKASYDNYKED